MNKTIIVVALAAAVLSGCNANRTASGDTFTAAQARQANFVTYGTLVSVRPVTIQGGDGTNAAGAIGGAVVGGFLGNTVGGGSGRSLATAAGAVGRSCWLRDPKRHEPQRRGGTGSTPG